MSKKEIGEVVKRAIDGDKAAFIELFGEYKDELNYFISHRIQNRLDAEDILQEVFISVYKGVGKLETPEAFNAWIYRIANNRVMDYLRKHKNAPLLLNEDGEAVFDNLEEDNQEFLPGEILNSDETKQAIADIVDELSDEQKSAVLLYYYKQMSVREIAQIMNCSEGTIKSRLNYARKFIHARIDEHEKKGRKILVVVPLPILTQILLWQAEQNKLSPEASANILSNLNNILDLVNSTATTANGGASTTTVGVKIAGVVVPIKVVATVAGVAIVIVTVAATLLNSKKEKNVSFDNTAVVQQTEIDTTEGSSEIITNNNVEVADSSNFDVEPKTKQGYAKFYYDFIQEYIIDMPDFRDAEMILVDEKDSQVYYNLILLFEDEYGLFDQSVHFSYAKKIKKSLANDNEILELAIRHNYANMSKTVENLVHSQSARYVTFDGNPALIHEESTKSKTNYFASYRLHISEMINNGPKITIFTLNFDPEVEGACKLGIYVNQNDNEVYEDINDSVEAKKRYDDLKLNYTPISTWGTEDFQYDKRIKAYMEE